MKQKLSFITSIVISSLDKYANLAKLESKSIEDVKQENALYKEIIEMHLRKKGVNLESALSFKFGSELMGVFHDIESQGTRVANAFASTLNNEIGLYKNTLIPNIREVVNIVSSEFANIHREDFNKFKFVELEPLSLVSNLRENRQIEAEATVQNFDAFRLDLSNITYQTFVTDVKKEFNYYAGDIEEFFQYMTEQRFETFKNKYLSDVSSDNTLLTTFRNYKVARYYEAVTLYLYAHTYYDEAPDNVKTTMEHFKSKMVVLRSVAIDVLTSSHDMLNEGILKETVIYSSNDEKVFVDRVNFMKAQEELEMETILGYLVNNKTHYNVSFEKLSKNKDAYQEAWDLFYNEKDALIKTKASFQLNELTLKYIIENLKDIEEANFAVDGVEDSTKIAVDEYLKKVDLLTISELKTNVENIYLDVVFGYTNARAFFNYTNKIGKHKHLKNGNDLTKATAVLLLTDAVIAQLRD